jgi:MFS family permease
MSAPNPPGMERTAHPLSIPDYRRFFTARFASNVAQYSMIVVIGWQVYDIARRSRSVGEASLQLGLIGMVQFVPLAALTLITGWTADRLDRRRIGQTTTFLEACCAATLAWLSYHGTTTLPSLYVVAFVLGICRAFANPAIGALAPNLVPAAMLPAAIATSSIAWQTGAIGGPALGGYLYASAHWLPYGVSAILFLVASVSLGSIGPLPRSTLDRKVHPWRQMIDGLHYVRRNRIVLGAISLDLFAVLLGGATAMLPVYARDILHAGPEGLGHLRAAPAVGAALTALWFGFRPLKRNVGLKMLAAVATFGAATVVFGLSRSMPLSLACLALLGASDMVSVFVRQSLIQIWTPNEMRGRVGAVSTLFISGSNELGEAESGFLGAAIGPVPAVVLGGIGAIGVTAAWWYIFPELARARTFDPPPREQMILEQEKVA